jgi:hypothetical protein
VARDAYLPAAIWAFDFGLSGCAGCVESAVKIYVVHKYVGLGPGSGKYDLFHRLLFHGRQQEKNYRLVDPCLGDSYTPLRWNRIGAYVPPVSAPTVNWVVSGQVRAALQALSLAFEPVEFRKLVDYPYYKAGDFSYDQTPAYRNAVRKDLLKFFEYLPNVPAFHKTVGPYYELVVPRLDDLLPSYRSTTRVLVQMQYSMPPRVEFSISEEILGDHPIVWDYHHILSERAFSAIEPFLDRDFFEIVEAQVIGA